MIAILLIIQQALAAPPPLPEDINKAKLPEPPPMPFPEEVINNGIIVGEDDINTYGYYANSYREIVQPFYIVYDDSRESKMMLRELERDWSSYDKSLEKIDELRDNLPVRELILIDYKDIKALDKHKIRNEVKKYPAYRSSASGEIKSFPSTAFACSTWPLLTIDALGNQASNRVEVWLKKASKIEFLHKSRLDSYNRQFILLKNLDLNKYTYRECNRCSNELFSCKCSEHYYGSWSRNFKQEELNKHPRYYPPIAIYPPKPETRMPWEYVNE